MPSRLPETDPLAQLAAVEAPGQERACRGKRAAKNQIRTKAPERSKAEQAA